MRRNSIFRWLSGDGERRHAGHGECCSWSGKESNTGGVQIDPTTFRKYNITAVPVLIVACGNGAIQLTGFRGPDLTSGPEAGGGGGDCADTARNLLGGEVQ